VRRVIAKLHETGAQATGFQCGRTKWSCSWLYCLKPCICRHSLHVTGYRGKIAHETGTIRYHIST
jgi:hypothetical protein